MIIEHNHSLYPDFILFILVIWTNIINLYYYIAWHAIAQYDLSRHGAVRRELSKRDGLTG